MHLYLFYFGGNSAGMHLHLCNVTKARKDESEA